MFISSKQKEEMICALSSLAVNIVRQSQVIDDLLERVEHLEMENAHNRMEAFISKMDKGNTNGKKTKTKKVR